MSQMALYLTTIIENLANLGLGMFLRKVGNDRSKIGAKGFFVCSGSLGLTTPSRQSHPKTLLPLFIGQI